MICGMSTFATPVVLGWHHSKLREEGKGSCVCPIMMSWGVLFVFSYVGWFCLLLFKQEC